MGTCEQLLDEGRRLLAEIRSDCRDQSLGGLFTGGFGVCRLKVADPCEQVADWTREASATYHAMVGPDGPDLASIPERGRKSLESDSSYSARCLKERLAALERANSLEAARG